MPDAASADVLVVTAAGGRHVLVEAGAGAVDRARRGARSHAPAVHRALRRRARARSSPATDWEGAWLAIAVFTAAESVGVAQRAMEMAVAYAKDRKQFDRPIGSYQAVSHACAQMLLETEGARAAVLWAAWALDHEPETAAPLAASVAKAYASDARAPRAGGGAAGPRRHRLHLGARPALPAQARAGERAHVRRRALAPRPRGRSRCRC